MNPELIAAAQDGTGTGLAMGLVIGGIAAVVLFLAALASRRKP